MNSPWIDPPTNNEAHEPFIRIETERFERSLCFGARDVQSAMDLREPDRLVLDYTRLMMGFLVFQPSPVQVLMIGLGGGSMAKFCHRHLPGTHITVVEIDPHVIALRNEFDIPADQATFNVVQGDGAAFVAAAESSVYDVILVDGFSGDGMAPSLGTSDFYAHCARVLSPHGVMACNLHEPDAWFGTYIDRVAVCFDGGHIVVPTSECGNSVVFARQGQPIGARASTRLHRPAHIPPSTWAYIEQDVRSVFQASKAARQRQRGA